MADAQTTSDPAWDALVKQATSSAAEGTEISRQLGESAKVKSGISARLLSSRPPPAPEMPAPVPPPAPPQQASPLQSFGSVATVLGILGGLLTRQPLTASLNAASGAMNAYRQRDLEAYRQNYETWKAQSEYLGKVAEWQQGQYKMALEQHKTDQDSLIATMNAIAARDQDLVMQHAIRTGDLRNVMQLLTDRDKAITEHEKVRLEAMKLGQSRNVELEAMKELEGTPEYRGAAPAQREQMLAHLHGEFARDAAIFGGPGQSPSEGKTGEEFLKTLKPDIATQVKALAQGRLAFPSGFALRSPYWQQLLQAVAQYDPTFDAVNYNARARTRQDFTSGQAARNITSFNTVMGHFDSLSKAWDALNNGTIPSVNAAQNALLQQAGDPRIQRFNLARNAVGDELERAFRGTGGNVTEIEQWKATLDSAASPAQQKAVVKQGLELLKSRIDAIGDQYNRGMGTTSDPLDLLAPHAKEAFARLGGEPEGGRRRFSVGEIIETPKGKYRVTGGDPLDPDVEPVQ